MNIHVRGSIKNASYQIVRIQDMLFPIDSYNFSSIWLCTIVVEVDTGWVIVILRTYLARTIINYVNILKK